MARKGLTPGTETPRSGLYDKIGPRGGDTGEQVSSTKGKPLPPTDKTGETWKLTKPAHHKSGK
jgi:hypothetical protein